MGTPTCQLRSIVRGHIRGIPVEPGTIYWAATEAEALDDIAERRAELIVPAPAKEPPAVLEPLGKKSILARARGWPVDRMTRVVEKAWSGETVFVIATGPSLTEEAVEKVRASGLHTIGVNDAYRRAPFLDVLYFADSKWYDWHKEALKAFPGDLLTIWASGNRVEDPRVHIIRNAGGGGLSLKPDALCTGSNSGYQALNLAVLAGPARIALLGFDAKRAADGKKHFFGEHPDKTEPPYAAMKQTFPSTLPVLKKLGISVVNCTPGSALTCFPIVPLESVLPHPA